MNITLADLPVGKWRFFTPQEISAMDELVATSTKTAGNNNFKEADMQE